MKLLLLALLINAIDAFQTPIVQIQNGSISGAYLETYNQDAYLGIPYAQAPVDSLRFDNPHPYNESWTDVREYSQYDNVCLATSGTLNHTDNEGQIESEDCLFLNVVKPHGNFTDKLPVAIWIHGGGYVDGSGSRQSYNLSFIVSKSVEIDKPFIGVSINYRLGGFGFLNSRDVSLNGWTNVGIKDQLKAVNWVHENIQAFGGDPNHLVIWGESAGAASVGKLITSGHLKDFVKGGIMESGNPLFKGVGMANRKSDESDYQLLVEHFNCSDSVEKIQCLQTIPAQDLRQAFNLTNGIVENSWIAPYIDGDVLPKSAYQSLVEGNYLKVPILMGTNTDEGAVFANNTLNSTEQVKEYLLGWLNDATADTVDKLNELYPKGDPLFAQPLDPTYNSTPIVFPNTTGEDYPRIATLFGDIFFGASSRKVAQIYTKDNVPVYKYRWNIPDLSLVNKTYLGAAHYQEVVYVFNNDVTPITSHRGDSWYPDPRSSNISSTISKLWISFITDLDPNAINVDNQLEVELPQKGWLDYKSSTQNVVFDLNGFYLENDTWRDEAFEYLYQVYRQLDW